MHIRAVFLALILNLACSSAHENPDLTGSWRGRQVYTYEEQVVSDTVNTLEGALGRKVQSTEVIRESVIFNFTGNSVSMITGGTKAELHLIPDTENSNEFLLVGDPTLALRIVKHTSDTLILEEQTAPVSLTLSDGKIDSSEKELIKSSFELTRIDERQP